MKKTRILWSGLTGRVGVAAIEAAALRSDVEIVAGICRRNKRPNEAVLCRLYTYEELTVLSAVNVGGIQEDFDVIVDFSHGDNSWFVAELATKVRKPLVSGTAGLTNRNMATLYDLAQIVPVFRGGNFWFEVKHFIDDVVEYARKCDEHELLLVETFYEGKELPSETSKVIQQKVYQATGKLVQVDSRCQYEASSLVCDWCLADLHCRMSGFRDLADNVLSIARRMQRLRATGRLYVLNDLIS